VTGALLVVPLALWAGVALFRRRREAIAVLAAMAAGAAIPAAAVALVLARSGLDPWRWSDYRLWLPVLFGAGGDVFHWRHAVMPDTVYLRPYTHAGVGLRVLLGVRGLPYHQYAGLFWPLAGWAALLALATVVPRDLGAPARLIRPAVLGLALWTLAHFVLFSCYFYPAGRFYLGPLALCATALGAASGLAAAAGGRGRAVAMMGSALVAASAVSSLVVLRPVVPRHAMPPPPLESQVAAKVARWRAMDDSQRSVRVLRFDPVFAQARGLLPPEVTAGVEVWGRLPPTQHVRRLVAAGVIPARTVKWGREREQVLRRHGGILRQPRPAPPAAGPNR
jgi:hypothetical protein